MRLSEFEYHIPRELIAKYPARDREKCRLMTLDRETRAVSHKAFEDITGYFNKGDLVVLNDTKVIPGRIFGRRKTGGLVELFILEKKNPVCEALVRPSGRLKTGEKIVLESGDEVEISERGEVGRFVRFNRPLNDILEEAGHIPLPPYIDRRDEESDREDYQTVYARREGATAAPTAGLHFTKALIERIRAEGVSTAYVTLHTSYGTFAPVKEDVIERHRMHKEFFEMPPETIEALKETKSRGGKVFAVGTTSVRVLEHYALKRPAAGAEGPGCSGHTDLFIYPGFKFQVVDRLITNFHLPRSTLILLVSAFAGRELILEAYQKAIDERYRFFSYGDAMLII